MARILVVEDDSEMASLVARGLTGEGHDVSVVANGVDALIALQVSGDAFDAAAIDVMLPEMTGFELCRRIRETGNTLVVILVTARDAVEDRIFGLDSGADDYLTKPFAIGELNARIRAQLRRQAAGSQTVVSAGNVRLDSVTVRASVHEKNLPLSVKEFGLLRHLIVHAGEAVSRSEILAEVWGSAEHFDPTIVDQYVSYVRKKLATVNSGVTIVTIRGLGYQLVADDDRAQALSIV